MQALLLVVALAAYASAVTPVSSVNTANYLGRWYQSKAVTSGDNSLI